MPASTMSLKTVTTELESTINETKSKGRSTILVEPCSSDIPKSFKLGNCFLIPSRWFSHVIKALKTEGFDVSRCAGEVMFVSWQKKLKVAKIEKL